MILYNDFTPFTATMSALALVTALAVIFLRRTGPMTPRKRSASQVLLLLTLTAATALTIASWSLWSLLLGPALAGALPLLVTVLFGVDIGRTHRAAVAARSER